MSSKAQRIIWKDNKNVADSNKPPGKDPQGNLIEEDMPGALGSWEFCNSEGLVDF